MASYSHTDENWKAELAVFVEEAICTPFDDLNKALANMNRNLNTMTTVLIVTLSSRELEDREVGHFGHCNRRREA